MYDEHGLILLESEIREIVLIVLKIENINKDA
jgi:hypothetical protein